MLSKNKLLAAIAVVIIVAVGVGLLLSTKKNGREQVMYCTFEDYINNSAWKGVANGAYPELAPDRYMNKSFEIEDYNAIQASDEELAFASSIDCETQEGYPYQLFRFKITTENIKTLSVRWEGFGKDFQDKCNGTTLYMWNDKYSDWVEVGNYSNRSGKQTIAYSSTDIPNMITNENFIFILAYCKTHGSGKSTSELATDYIELKVEL